jgi:predicted phage terminase large subunit-like protein
MDTLNADSLNDFDFSACVLDDSRIDPIDVFSDYLNDRDSFYSEYQNMPLSQDNLTFAGFKTYKEQPECDTYGIGIDPSLGRRNSTYFAVSVIGYSSQLNKFYWSARGYKIKPGDMIPILIRTYVEVLKHGKPIKIGIETVQFQEFFAAVLKKEAGKLGLHLPIVELKNTVAKELRIDSLSPYVTDGTIEIDEHSHLLIDELLTYPKSPHSDLLDSGEMAYRVLSKAAVMNYNAINKVMKNANFKKRLLMD